MSALVVWVLVVAALPLLVWLVAGGVVAGRRLWRRRGDEPARRRRFARLLGRRDLVVVPTGDVDLPETAVLEVAADAGFEFLGYERADTLFRRRVGVFIRVGGGVDRTLRSVGVASR